MCTRSHQLLRPDSLGFHSAPNSDSPWLPENQHTWLPCCPHFFPENTAQSPSYLCICGLNDLQSSPSHIPGHTGLPRGETALHSGYTHGGLGTADSGCHSLEDTSQVDRNVHGFPRGSSITLRDEAVQPGVLSKAADRESRSQASSRDCRTYQLGDLALVTPRLWASAFSAIKCREHTAPPSSLDKGQIT